MDLNSDQKELVELFVRQEFLIGKLYKLFSYRYPQYKVFWTEMAMEEHLHASWIKRLSERDPTDKFKFSQGELRTNYLASSIKSIESLIGGVKNNREFPIAQAVSMALQLEKGLWEKKVFQCFEGDSDEVRRILDTLNLEQEFHIKKIDKFARQFLKKCIENDSP
ncbi:MAG: hypothetical protein WCD00_16770 [Desulfuromonadaceae bacterium]